MRICANWLMPNHWHFVLWPEHDGDMGAFLQKLTVMHVRNWQEHRRRVGYYFIGLADHDLVSVGQAGQVGHHVGRWRCRGETAAAG